MKQKKLLPWQSEVLAVAYEVKKDALRRLRFAETQIKCLEKLYKEKR